VGLSESIQVKIIIAIFVFTFCYATTPFTTVANLSYTPVSTAVYPNAQTATAGNTNTTYDQAMPDVHSISSTGSLDAVPMWWYLVMSLSAGFNDSVRGGINNADKDLRLLEGLARTVSIADPELRADIHQFVSECYLPARSQYLYRTDKSDPNQYTPAISDPILDPSNQEYGPTDVDWMGSKVFYSDPHFYAAFKTRTPVKGYSGTGDPYNASVDTGGPFYTTSAYGWPTCQQWGLDSLPVGLRARIAGQMYNGELDQLKTGLSNVAPGMDQNLYNDIIARRSSSCASTCCCRWPCS
jgi:hypothetical protein